MGNFHVGGIVIEPAVGLNQFGDATGQGSYSADILGHTAHTKRTAPCLEAHKQVDQTGQNTSQRTAERTPCTCGTLQHLIELAAELKTMVSIQIMGAYLLLVIHSEIQCAMFILSKESKRSEHAIVQENICIHASKTPVDLGVAQGAENSWNHQGCHEHQHKDRVIEYGEPACALRDTLGKQAHSKNNST